MTDRELLELAAKAAGYYYHGHRTRSATSDKPGYENCYVSTTNDTDDWFVWSPLTDDGDALRLAVKLEMDVMCASVRTDCGIVETIQAGTDIYAATRRAIVRAAAAITQDGGART